MWIRYVGRFQKFRLASRCFSTGAYDKVHSQSIQNRKEFWGAAADNVHWFDDAKTKAECPVYRTKHPQLPEDDPKQEYSWFPDRSLNTCYNALDLHVEQGHGDQLALIYDSPVTQTKRTFTYQQILSRVERIAGALVSCGVKKGDRVLIYMPMIPDALSVMLACARVGAIHCVVFGGFAAHELAKRIDQATPSMIFSASCGIEPSRVVQYKPILDKALELSAHTPADVVVLQREQARATLTGAEHDFEQWLAGRGRPHPCVPVSSSDPLYIIHTSGTTGSPKGVVRDCGGHMVAMRWTLKNVYGITPGCVWWAASDIGWVVGHSYILYAPFLNRVTSVLYEGKPVGTPDAGAFWRVIQEHKVTALFTAPTAFRAIKKEDPTGQLVKQYDISSLKTLFLAGERADPDTVSYAQEVLGRPVIDHYWQTESGWPIVANCVGVERFPTKLGSSTKPVPGWDVCVVDETGKPVPTGTMGNIVVRLPLPPGALQGLWKEQDRYFASYFSRFPGFYDTTDQGYMDADGYVFIMSRSDDVLNVAGHRLSSGALEEALSNHTDVAEAAVIGVSDQLKGQMPVGFVVLNSGASGCVEVLKQECLAMVRERVGAVASLKAVLVVPRLPKTRSGKILRATMRSLAEGHDFNIPATIEDAAVLDEIADALKAQL